jgi:hypothetical protein
MANIFFSYSVEDQPLVQYLAESLQKHGHSSLFAGTMLKPGDLWRETLSDTLRTSDVFIVIVSKNSINSRWLMTETGAALGYFRERSKPIIIPIIFDKVEIPDPLKEIQVLYASGDKLDDVVQKLLTVLDNFIGQMQAKDDIRKETYDRVEKNSAIYIQKSLDELRKRENKYQRNAYIWYTLAYTSLILGVLFGIFRGLIFKQSTIISSSPIQFIVASILIVSLLIALSRFAFVLGKSFMVEALRNADRIHAISFGEFYLNSFGDKADWKEVKDVFQHWNIDKGSSFIHQTASDYDPEIIKNAIEIAKILMGNKKKS